MAGIHGAAQNAERLGHIVHGGQIGGALGGGGVQLVAALLGQGGDLVLLVLGGEGVGGLVKQRQLHRFQIGAVVGDVVQILLLRDGVGAVLAVDQLQADLGLLGIEQIGFQASLADAVGGVKIAVGLPQGIGALGGLGGGGVIQNTAQFLELFLHRSVILQAAQRQAGHIVSAVGGHFLVADGAGALGLEHRLDIAGGLAGGKLSRTGGGVVGIILGQQVNAGGNVHAADGAHAGRGGHSTARNAQQHHDRQGQADELFLHGGLLLYDTFFPLCATAQRGRITLL